LHREKAVRKDGFFMGRRAWYIKKVSIPNRVLGHLYKNRYPALMRIEGPLVTPLSDGSGSLANDFVNSRFLVS
jgi:hypothetical protein